MDIFSHALLPLALFALVLKRPKPEWLAAGLGAAMPDMDFFFSWLTLLEDAFYAFGHRGWSHSILGAPLLAVAGLVLLTRVFSRRWRRLRAFEVSALTVGAALAGAWAHLALDALTISGVPALWPLSNERFTVNLYFYSVAYMIPVSAYLIWRLWKRTLDERLLRRGIALLLAVLVVSGAVRMATMPRGAPEGAVVQPTPNDLRWIVALPVEGGWVVGDHGPLEGDERSTFRGNASPAAGEAIARARALGAYAAWSWNHPAPVVNTSAVEGGWRVEFRDAIALHRNATGGILAGALREPKPLVVEVVGDRARVVERPAAFGLGTFGD